MSIETIRMALDDDRRMAVELDTAFATQASMCRTLRRGSFWEADVSRFLRAVLRPGDGFVDVGAHVGWFAVLAATLMGADGRVQAVEADPANFARLRRNLALNGLDRVRATCAVAAEQAGRRRFWFNADNEGGNALWDPGLLDNNPLSRAGPRAEELEAVTLDALLADFGPVRVLKIDVEGAEPLVLSGASRLLREAPPDHVICELHDFGLRAVGWDQHRLRGLMADHGYACRVFRPDGTGPVPVPDAAEVRGGGVVLNLRFTRVPAPGDDAAEPHRR